MSTPLTQEPILFTIGDTLDFARYLPDYMPSDGWMLQYQIQGGANSDTPVTFTSTTYQTNEHRVTVAGTVTDLWVAGSYTFTGSAYNSSTGERHQIYYGVIELRPDSNATNTSQVKPYDQQQVELLQATLLELNAHALNESDINGQKLVRERRKEITWQLGYWQDKMRQRIAAERVRNGMPSGNTVRPQFNIFNTGPYFQGR